ncbi:MAG: hypothetical protein LIQ30_13645 [Planctomycetes bacterium]|nr:hypothetical protein [Planctomycetota bacterium]MCD7895387.1 hypothetical protein [Planctomycetaceae bacterium]
MFWLVRLIQSALEGLDEVARTYSGWPRLVAWLLSILLVIAFAYRYLYVPFFG